MSLSLLLLGFLVGMRHAMEADHVAAVASLVTQSKSVRQAVVHGASWGLGHTITLFLFGTVALLVDSIIPENYAARLEFAVGIMLIILGVDVLRRLIKQKIHFHVHQHADGKQHFHAHSHQHDEQDDHHHTHNHRFSGKAMLVGLVHGMAGSAALVLLTLNTAQSLYSGMLYMLVFGLGSILGMAVLSITMAVPLRYSARNMGWLFNGLQAVVGIATIYVGIMALGNWPQMFV